MTRTVENIERRKLLARYLGSLLSNTEGIAIIIAVKIEGATNSRRP